MDTISVTRIKDKRTRYGTVDLVITNGQGRWYGQALDSLRDVKIGEQVPEGFDWEYLQDNGEYIPAK